MLHPLKNKTIVIVGASRGLGAALARILALPGNKLILVARSEDKLQAIQKDCEKQGASCQFYLCDIAQSAAVKRIARQIIKDYPEVNVLIANAAVSNITKIYDPDQFEYTVNVNLFGATRFIMPFAAHFRLRNQGLIVGINSMVGLNPMPLHHGYGTSKAALRMYIKSLRLSFKKTNIKCINVFPGFFASDMTANIDHTKPMEITAEAMATKIVNRMKWGLNEIYIPWIFGFLSLVGQMLPTFLYNRLFERRYFGRFFNVEKYL